MNNLYADKNQEFINNIHNQMVTFEITKCCGYSTFVAVYKNQNLMDLYNTIVNHFEYIQIKELFFLTPEREKIIVPVSKQVISEFVRSYVVCNPCKLVPIYNLPNPIVYRLYVNDGHHCEEHQHTNIDV